MATLHPDFMSVTYGAGGSNGGISTCEIAGYIQNQLEIPALAHLTCVGADRNTIRENLAQLHTAGVHNILALRGDANPNLPFSKEFPHASHLAEEILKQGGFCVAGACRMKDNEQNTFVLRAGETVLLPATVSGVTITPETGGVKLLETYV